ncbi:MAG: helix-turn-helix domain-containing protein [Herpetosiphonaceae bacterium]|nr:helix-turn-helix domain-containing protein [Herpetosiphonaceae bacterium]
MDTQTSASFGTLLRECRLAAGLTQEGLAERAGISARTVRLLEQGGSTPQRATAERLVTALGVAGEEVVQFLAGATSGPRRHTSSSKHVPTPHAWPLPPTDLVGREGELATVLALLEREQTRVLTLTGPGGVGKTRLALAVALQFQEQGDQEVLFVALAPLDAPEFVLPTIARAVGVPEDPSRPILTTLSIALRNRPCLLVLDNFEHIAAAGPEVAALRAACPGLRLLVTSRVVLHVQGEQVYPIPSLALATPHHLPPLDVLLHVSAVQLFIERAQAVKPDFALTAANAATVVQICAQLDGLPLAIELAATRVGILPVQALQRRLQGDRMGQSLQLLTGGARDLPQRQRTVRDTIAWSYTLLPEVERSLFRWLGVFRGGWSLPAAEAICADHLSLDALDGLISLTEQSLLVVQDEDGEPRFGMLETIREYALEQLEANGETEVTRREHATYYLRLAHDAEPMLLGAHQLIWLKRLEAEHDNLRAALRWFLNWGDADGALHLSGDLAHFWFLRGYWSEGRRWLEAALKVDEGREPDTVWTKVRTGAGLLAYYQGDYGRAATLCGESLWLSRQLGDQRGIVAALHGLAQVARAGDNYTAARAMYEESVDILRMLNDTWGLARTLNYLGISLLQDDPGAARPLIAEGLALFRQVGDRWGIALSLNDLGTISRLEGKFAEARLLLEETLDIFRMVGDKRGINRTLWLLAEISYNEGDYASARRLYMEALEILGTLGERVMTPVCLDGLAAVATAQGQLVGAARLFAVATVLRDASGATAPAPLRAQREENLARTRAVLGEVQFAAAWSEGQTMMPEQAVAQLDSGLLEIQTVMPYADAGAPALKGVARLTRREHEVLRLVAQGLTDVQVAAQLVVSPRTINAHLSSIYNKLGVNSRTTATRYALDHRLV